MASLRLALMGVMLAACSTYAMQDAHLLRAEHHQILQAAQANPLEGFKSWVVSHAKEYLEDVVEFNHRFKVWLSNLEYVLEYNARTTSHWLHMNALADLTADEYQQLLGYDNKARLARNRLRSTAFKYADVDADSLPPAVDWRKLNAVTEVKNQMQCGSCWAFSTTGAVEGVNAVVTKELVSLSEQELVDCDTEQDRGCSGGLMDYAYQFIMNNGGLDTEDDYPYRAEDGECDANKRNRHVVTIDGFEDVPQNDELALKKAAAHQPIAVAIEADAKSFQLYGGGVYDDAECGTSLNHGVLLVGYGKDPAAGTYWIVKNSWGPEWGDSGYIKLKMGVSDAQGLCGIAMAASYPTKNGPNPSPSPEPSPAPHPSPKPSPSPHPKPSPSPSPEPVKCDDDAECPAGTTCCCVNEVFGMCFQWGCCPMPQATCCDDHEHCCPSDLPVCDTDAGRCLPKAGMFTGSVAWSSKVPARRRPGSTTNMFVKVFNRGLNRLQQQQ